METKKVTQVVYIANDGKEFLTEEECKKHEAFVKEVLCNISYYIAHRFENNQKDYSLALHLFCIADLSLDYSWRTQSFLCFAFGY